MDDIRNDLKNDLQSDLKELRSSKGWFSFDKMLTPVIIKILFWIGLVFSVVMGLITIFRSFGSQGSAINLITGLLIIVLGPVMVRMYCEIMIVVFKIHDTLLEIKKNTDR